MNTHDVPHDDWLARAEAHLVQGSPLDVDVKSHLGSCAVCRQAWRDMRDAAEALRQAPAFAGLNTAPPVELRERVRAAVLGNAQGGRSAPASSVPAGGTWIGRIGHMRWAWAAAGGLVGAAAVAAIALVIGLGGNGVDMTSDGGRQLSLRGLSLARDASGTVVIQDRDNGVLSMVLTVSGLPALGNGEFYEVWWVDSSNRHTSCGSFRVDASGVAGPVSFTTAGNLASVDLIEITRELDDGDTRPGSHVAESTN